MLRVCFYGPPGSGKSTLAAELFCHLKKKGINCELVNELAREWAYLNRPIVSCDQIYLFASQMNREDTLLSRNKVDVVITDSPVYLNAFYGILKDAKLMKGLQSLARYFDLKYESVNFFCKLNNNFDFNESGRFHNHEQSKKLEEDMLEDIQTYFRTILMDINVLNNDNNRLEQVLEHIESKISVK